MSDIPEQFQCFFPKYGLNVMKNIESFTANASSAATYCSVFQEMRGFGDVRDIASLIQHLEDVVSAYADFLSVVDDNPELQDKLQTLTQGY